MSWILVIWVLGNDGNPYVRDVQGIASREACESAGAALKKSVKDTGVSWAGVAYVCAPGHP